MANTTKYESVTMVKRRLISGSSLISFSSEKIFFDQTF